MTAQRHWYLYWVESDGIEDCFVIARNSRSARAVEIDMNGFAPGTVRATRILRIPKSVEHFYKARSGQQKRHWPWYPYGRRFFEKLGAEFRTIDNQQEMLLCEVVYNVDEFIPGAMYKARSIGFKAVDELSKLPGIDHNYDDEDVWPGREIHLITALGMCLARCQLIEHYIVHSFLLGASKKQKAKYKTINDLRNGWKEKTLGTMLRNIEEAWDIEPVVKASFELFLQCRNKLVHGLTTSDRYNIRTQWGQLELWAFLSFFDVHSRLVKKAFRASYYASLQFGVMNWGSPKGVPKKFLTKKQEDEMSLFGHFFSPKLNAF